MKFGSFLRRVQNLEHQRHPPNYTFVWTRARTHTHAHVP
jgi:hypothetical protein